jgi:hypothetical protein
MTSKLPITPKLQRTFLLAQSIATKIGDKYVGIEHFKLALLQIEFPVEFDKLIAGTKKNLTSNPK